MSFFNKILDALGIGRADASPQPTSDPTVTTSPGTAPPAAGTTSGGTSVDVGAKLEALSAQHPGLNWRTSIVDLLKLLNIDSSLANRKELALELGYTGSTEDSATMNIWLHKAVLTKLSENGGQVPAELLD